LRREEVALLAAIGAGWYTKLETGDDVKPSPATLLSITRVLRMSRSETEYTFSLAAVAMPISVVPPEDDRVPLMVEHLIERPPSVGAVLWDRYVTAVRWNAMFDFARFPDPMKRNAVVRLQRDQFRTEYYPEDHEDLLQNLVGMFRRAYLAEEPTPFARKVYELASDYKLFQKLWKQQIVAEEFFHSNSTPRSRNHPAVGRFSILGANLRVVGRGDFFLRIIGPADAASAEKFKTLARLGTPSSSQTIVPEHIVGLG
jgi:transcriptional regulator with XRE-family HTH domain